MVSRRTRVVSWIFRRDHPSRPKAMICCFFSSFKTFAMLREATYPPAAVNVPDVSSESMAAFQVFLYGRFWVFTEALPLRFRLLFCMTGFSVAWTSERLTMTRDKSITVINLRMVVACEHGPGIQIRPG